MQHSLEENPQVQVIPPDRAKIARLWTVAGILGGVTIIEFIIAFLVPHGTFKVFLFVALTIVKAAYIVGEFMHLRYEVKVLMWSILVPMVFVAWMLVAFLMEGFHIGSLRPW